MIGGHVIPGGSIYTGQRLPSGGDRAEPSLIDPDLPISEVPGRYQVPGAGPGLSYRLLSPVARKAYLDWLAGGRRTDVMPGLVQLFCLGLERRILADDRLMPRELPVLAAETRRLRARYGGATGLREPLDRLLDLLDLLTGGLPAGQDAPGDATPAAVRITLARFAVASAPIPAPWARAWLRHHPSLTPRRSESDCPAEFERLFTLRYQKRYGEGMVAAVEGAGVRLRYHPSNPGLSSTLVWRADLPDLLSEASAIRPLVALRDEVAAALEPYRRWLARFPQGHDSLAAVPLLPPELVDVRYGRLGAMRVWAEGKLDGQPRAVIDAAEFGEFWSAADPERMAADEAGALLSVLARLGFGVEPDVRFGAPSLMRGPAVLFRLGRPAGERPGARFAAAAAIVRCAAAVASAASPRGPAELAVLATVVDLAAALRLEPGEDVRLAARFGWLLSARVEVDRLARQTTTMTPAEREIAGHYLITVAVAADPVIGPATVTVLTRVYRILGLPVDLVFQRLHDRSTGGIGRLPKPGAEPAGERPDHPVVIQTGHGRPEGFALPWASETAFPLDRSLIERRVAESDTAAALLSEIFAEEEPAPVRAIPGLDRVHTALLHALGERLTWTREEYESLAAGHGVMPDGALDLLNEVAIDMTGAPLLDGDAVLTVADDVLLELLV